VGGELFFAEEFGGAAGAGWGAGFGRAGFREAAAAAVAGVAVEGVNEIEFARVGREMVHGAEGGGGDVREVHFRGEGGDGLGSFFARHSGLESLADAGSHWRRRDTVQ
jgi:hypothetical protein